MQTRKNKRVECRWDSESEGKQMEGVKGKDSHGKLNGEKCRFGGERKGTQTGKRDGMGQREK